MRDRIAVLHHHRSYFPLDFYARVRRVAEILWVVDAEILVDPMTRRLLARLGTVIDVSGLDLDAKTRQIAHHQPDGILSFCDERLVEAADIAHRLGLRFHSPEVARILTDKTLQRAAFETAGIPGPRFWAIDSGTGIKELEATAEILPYPCVLKPANGSGSRGIVMLRSPEDLLELAVNGETTNAVIVEEYLADDPSATTDWSAGYFSVETVVQDGQSTHVALTGRFPLADPFRETGNFIPACVGSKVESDAFALVDSVVSALGIVDSMLHTEIKITVDGLRLIEVNGRMGGRPPFVLEDVSDVNLFEVACANSVGRKVDLPSPIQTRGVGFWRMIQPPTDAVRVDRVAGVDVVRELLGVDTVTNRAAAGGAVDWREGTHSWVTTVRGHVSDHNELRELFHEIDASLKIDYVRDGR